jgi:hypothetical protein
MTSAFEPGARPPANSSPDPLPPWRLTVIAGTGEDSVFGYGFLPGILALVIWSIATSIASYRALTTARGLGD